MSRNLVLILMLTTLVSSNVSLSQIKIEEDIVLDVFENYGDSWSRRGTLNIAISNKRTYKPEIVMLNEVQMNKEKIKTLCENGKFYKVRVNVGELSFVSQENAVVI